jgi:hypothetical protein
MMQCLVELGADNNKVGVDGKTPLILAASHGKLSRVRCLVTLGASIGVADNAGETALHASAGVEALHFSAFSTMQYLLEHAGASMDDVNNNGNTVWDLLTDHLQHVKAGRGRDQSVSLAALLRVLVLRGDPPPALVALLWPLPANVVQEGARLRAQLPAYYLRQRALLDVHCPVLLPPLRALVHGYMELTTEEVWATGLGKEP